MKSISRNAIVPLATIQLVFFVVVSLSPLALLWPGSANETNPLKAAVIMRTELWDFMLMPWWFLGFAFTVMVLTFAQANMAQRAIAALAILAVIGAHLALLSEEAMFLDASGELKMPTSEAFTQLTITRLASPALAAVAAVFAHWLRHRSRRS